MTIIDPQLGTNLRIAATFCLILLFAPGAARAAQYEIDVDVETEEDIFELQQSGQISESTADTLVDLLQSGVDLETASRSELYALPNLTYSQVDAILEYRQASGNIRDPAQLVAAGALTADELKRIAPFLVIGPERERLPVSGHAKLMTNAATTDPVLPAAYLKVRLSGYNLKAGAAILHTRQRLGAVSYDERRDALRAPLPVSGAEIPKFYVSWSSSQRTLMAGTFAAGFAERLTLDNTTRGTPNGFYVDDTVYPKNDLSSACREGAGELGASPCEAAGTVGLKMTPDFRWRDRFRGVAGSVEDLRLGSSARASFYAFGSYATRSIYQYQLYDRSRCEDPRMDEQDACAAPPVFAARADDTSPTSKLQYVTLPSVFDEATGGAHAALALDDRTSLGVTGYYSSPRWMVEGMRLDFQEWSPYPFHGDFGAVGVNGATRLGPVNMFIEGARSFDSMAGGGGGFAVLQRNTLSLAKHQEVEVSLRYYDRNYANPYSRAIAADDRMDGNRGRNEAGARVYWTGRKMRDFSARAVADFWVWPGEVNVPGTAGRSNMELTGRLDFDGWEFLRLAGWVGHVNRDLSRNGLGNCYTDYSSAEVPEDQADSGLTEPLPCSGERYDVGGRITALPFGPRWNMSLTYRQAFATWDPDEPRMASYQTLTAELRAKPVDPYQVRLRVRYFNESDPGLTRDDNSVWGTVEGRWLPSRQLHLGLRYDLVAFTRHLADPSSTRRPNPEHRLRLQLESRF